MRALCLDCLHCTPCLVRSSVPSFVRMGAGTTRARHARPVCCARQLVNRSHLRAIALIDFSRANSAGTSPPRGTRAIRYTAVQEHMFSISNWMLLDDEGGARELR